METTIRNRVQLMGNLGKDPEVREFDGGKRMARFSVATNERYNLSDGQTKEDTQWHNVVAWGRVAEQAAQQLRKGSRVALEGRLVHRAWEKDGQKRWSTEVVLTAFQPLNAETAQAA